MKTNQKKPKLFLNFLISFLIIVFAFSLDRYYKSQKAEKPADAPAAIQKTSDTLAPDSRIENKAGKDTVTIQVDTDDLLHGEK